MLTGAWHLSARSWILGIALPLLVLLLLSAAVATGLLPPACTALLALVPLMCALWSPPALVSSVGVLTWSCAYLLTYSLPRQDIFVTVLLLTAATSVVATAISTVRIRHASRLSEQQSAALVEQQLRATSEVDPLTGLFNARGFTRTVAARIAPVSTVAVMAADCDDSRIAQEVTRAVGWRLRAALPDEDVLARWADKEFVLMCDVNYPVGCEVVTSVHTAITAEPLATSVGQVPALVPAGASPWADEPVEEAIVRARLRMASSRSRGYRPVLSGPGKAPAA